MEMKWSKTAEGAYAFHVNGAEMGKLDIAWSSNIQLAKAEMDGRSYKIKRVGFWKGTIEITDKNDMPVAKVYPEKWYASTSILEYKDYRYKLLLRNNPMAEYVITCDNEDVLAYGLFAEKGKSYVKIAGTDVDSEPLFHALLWYLFAPIVHESLGDNFSPFFLLAV